MEGAVQVGRALIRAAAFVIGSIALLFGKATRDGTLPAFGRQGADEIGAALKAFPDSIQTQEPGTLLNPTQGEIAADRKVSVYGKDFRSPSDIAAGRGSVFGRGDKQQTLPSPSQIAASRGGPDAGPESHRGQDRDLGR